MLGRIALEVLLAVATLFTGRSIWQLHKRAKFLKHVICNQPYLERSISPDALINPSPMIAPFIEQNQTGYFMNIKCVIEADRVLQRRVKIAFGLVLAAIFVGSYFIGVLYFIINIVLFSLTASAPISQRAQANALRHVLTLAVILRQWHLENSVECEQWVEQAWSLRPLYDVVKKIH